MNSCYNTNKTNKNRKHPLEHRFVLSSAKRESQCHQSLEACGFFSWSHSCWSSWFILLGAPGLILSVSRFIVNATIPFTFCGEITSSQTVGATTLLWRLQRSEIKPAWPLQFLRWVKKNGHKGNGCPSTYEFFKEAKDFIVLGTCLKAYRLWKGVSIERAPLYQVPAS